MIFANYLFVAMLSLISPSHRPIESPGTQEPLMTINQNGVRQQIIPGSNTIRLSRAPFDIEFTLNGYKAADDRTLQFAAFKEVESLDLISDGKHTYEIPYFEPNSGLPRPRRGPYQYLNLNKAGHHFIFYESKTSCTADMVTELDEGGYELKWTVDSVYENKTASSIRDIKHSSIYCVAFFDKNDNKIAESGEYAKIEIDFK